VGTSGKDRTAILLGLLALAGYAAHAGVHLARGEPQDLLWACHLGAAIVGVGLLAGSAAVNGVGTLLLCMGTPLWLMELAAGEEFLPTSCLTHVGGLAVGLWGVWRLGMPGGCWWRASATLVGLIALCRLVTPSHANVNVAFRIQPGWERYYSSHLVYLAVNIGLAAGYFWLLEVALGRWLSAGPGASGSRRH
jgi:hypothetical protein